MVSGGTPGVVVSAGKMMKTVKVQMVRQHWNRYIRKNYKAPYNILVHDENSSLVEGDIITTARELHTKNVHRVVKSILVPFGTPVEERPPLLTREERYEIRMADWEKRLEKKKVREAEDAKLRLEEKRLNMPRGTLKRVDDGGAGGGKGPDGKGRAILPQGLHKFGLINQEGRQGKRKANKRLEKAAQNDKDKQTVLEKSDEDYQREALGI